MLYPCGGVLYICADTAVRTRLQFIILWLGLYRSIGVIKRLIPLVLHSTGVSVLCWVKISMALGTVPSQGQDISGCMLDGIALGRFVSMIRAPHRDCLLTGFVGLGREAARLLKI